MRYLPCYSPISLRFAVDTNHLPQKADTVNDLVDVVEGSTVVE